MMVGIYIIISPTNKIYIGQSRDMIIRAINYKNLNCKKQPHIYNSIKKHGWDKHVFDVLLKLKDNISQSELNYWEQIFMNHYKGEGYKLMNLKDAGSKGKLSKESIEKIRGAKKGTHLSEATKEKLRILFSGDKNPFFGKKHTTDTLSKIPFFEKGHVPWNKGRPTSEITKRKISIANKKPNKKSKPIYQANFSGRVLNIWKSYSEAHRGTGISASHIKECCDGKRKSAGECLWQYDKGAIEKAAITKQKPVRYGKNNYKAKPVIQLSLLGDFVEEWSCIADASRTLKIPGGNISKCCLGERNLAGGFLWKHKDNVLCP